MRLFRLLRALALGLCLLWLSGCAMLSSSRQPPPAQNPWAAQAPYEWPPYQQPLDAELQVGPAPAALLAEADLHYQTGRSEASAAALERALRLDPRAPLLWYRLAGLRASDGDYSAAKRLAEKAHSLLNSNSARSIRQWVLWLDSWLLEQLSSNY